MSSHTPGPWRTREATASIPTTQIMAPGPNPPGRYVCSVSGNDREANARLIAAAPELLAALEEAVRIGGGSPHPAWALIRAVIAKAKGGKP